MRYLAAFVLCLAAVPALAQPRPADDEPSALEVPGGDIFGFTSPTDVGNVGDKAISFETTTRIGKAGGGRYSSPTLKTQLSATIAPNLAVAVSPFVTAHRIRSVPDLPNRSAVQFDGFSAEIAYRVLERGDTQPLAATVSVEARAARVDALTGERAASYGAELKLFLDAVLVKDKLFGALNLNYAASTQEGFLGSSGTTGSGTNLSGALAYQVSETLFVGAETRFLTAFSGAVLDRLAGHAVFAGPNVLVKLSKTATLNVGWTPQIVGRAQGSDRPLDLDNFERSQLRVKLVSAF